MVDELQATPQEQPTPAPAIDIEKIIADLRTQGYEDEKIIEALKGMVAEGKLSEEDLSKALALLEKQDKESASKLFGVDII